MTDTALSPERIAALVAEDDRRRARLFAAYDPVRGIGSHVPRVDVPAGIGGEIVRVPVAMQELPAVQALVDAGSMGAFAAMHGLTPEQASADFARARFAYDYEFWAALCVTIETKDPARPLVPLIMNLPQRISLARREAARTAGRPVRIIELKHRQYGSTTEKVAYFAWLQNAVYTRWNAFLVHLEKDGAAVLRGKYDTLAAHYPPEVGSITFRPVRGSTSALQIAERLCRVRLGSVTNPQAPSGDTVQGALISEAGKMGSGEVQDAGRLMTNLMSLIPMEADTVVLPESTAEQSGVWFQRQYEAAVRGESAFDPLFLSWTDDPQYTRPVPVDLVDWLAAWTPYEWTLWDAGATMGGMAWHQIKRREYDTLRQMQQEFPATPAEAFQSQEGRVFRVDLVGVQKKHVRQPLHRGYLRAEGETGEDAFVGLRFEPHPRGPLSIWREPHDALGGIVPAPARVAHRYCAGSDVSTGLSESANYSVTVVLDRAARLVGGFPEVVAEWHGREDADLYAWQAAQVAWYYDKAFWAIERNSYDFRPPSQQAPSSGLVVVDEIASFYPNLYLRGTAEDDLGPEPPRRRAGWVTNKETKGLMVRALRKALRGAAGEDGAAEGYVERSEGALREIEMFSALPGGKMGAPPGEKDDRAVARMIALHLDQTMPVPVLVQPRTRRPVRPPGSYASFS